MNRNYLNNGVRQGYRTVPPRAVPAMSGGSCGMTQSQQRSNPQLQSQSPSQPNPQHGSGMALAMAYVPSQAFEGLYPAAEALRHGTLFTALNLPYCAGGGR